MVAGDGAWVLVLLDDDSEMVVGRLVGLRADLAGVDVLARLQLAARRVGLEIRLRGPCEELKGLLELVGLADVVVVESSRLAQARRQVEGVEELGVEEVVEPDDPVA